MAKTITNMTIAKPDFLFDIVISPGMLQVDMQISTSSSKLGHAVCLGEMSAQVISPQA
jgi:hypothetical protein